jgi:hypothetical protein
MPGLTEISCSLYSASSAEMQRIAKLGSKQAACKVALCASTMLSKVQDKHKPV